MTSAGLFALAALAEIAGAYLVWQGVRGCQSALMAIIGGLLLAAYGVVASLQPEPHFGRVLAAYGGVFVVGSLLWGIALDGFRPTERDLLGAGICVVGVLVIMSSPDPKS